MTDFDGIIPAYERIAHAWRTARIGGATEFEEGRLLDRALIPLDEGARILDVGCGSGEPITKHLADRGFRVVGLDGSAKMIELARNAVPMAEFIQGDIRESAPEGRFDAIVAWDVVFHIPRGEHHDIFARFHSWLRPGGRLLVSLGGSGDDALASEMLGETFHYSAYEPAVAVRIIEESGFHVEHWEFDDTSSRGHIAVIATREPVEHAGAIEVGGARDAVHRSEIRELEERVISRRRAGRRHTIWALLGLSPGALLPFAALLSESAISGAVALVVLVTGTEIWRAKKAERDAKRAEDALRNLRRATVSQDPDSD